MKTRLTIILAVAIASAPAMAQDSKTLNSYLPYMHTAADWAQINWAEQVTISKELAASAGFNGAVEINACMDTAAQDIRYKGRAFKGALAECVRYAKEGR